MLLFIDNFDSFTFNLIQAFEKLSCSTHLECVDSISIEKVLSLSPKYIVIGPGPGHPSQALVYQDLLEICTPDTPFLGICLGHQIIAETYGARVVRASYPMHGKASTIFHDNQGVFRNIPQGFQAVRYHSLIVERASVKPPLLITAETETGEIMGLRHQDLSIEGVQFHPESILTEHGPRLLANFLDLTN